MAAKSIPNLRLAIIVTTAIGFLALATPSLADTGSVYFDGGENVAAGSDLFVGLGVSVM